MEYEYWMPGETKPESMPEGVEYYCTATETWRKCGCTLTGWVGCKRRWPKIKENVMKKDMFKKCLNEDKKIFEMLPTDVQRALRESKFVEYYTGHCWTGKPELSEFGNTGVYRIMPGAPVEPEIVEAVVCGSSQRKQKQPEYNMGIMGCVLPTGGWRSLMTAVCHTQFRGIVYKGKDGKEKVHCMVNFLFGTPTKVLFEKE